MAVSPWPVAGVTAPTVKVPTDVPTSSTSITTDTVWLAALNFSNTTAAMITFTITNTAGDKIRTAIPVVPGVDYSEALPFLQCVGIKWVASATGLTGQAQYH